MTEQIKTENSRAMRGYKFCLLKAYFDKGLSLTNYFKYVIAFFALGSQNVELTMIFAFIYAVLCFFIGLLWYKFGLIKAEIEVQNQFNIFVNEMREKFK